MIHGHGKAVGTKAASHPARPEPTCRSALRNLGLGPGASRAIPTPDGKARAQMLCRGPQSDPAVETRARRRGRVRGDSHLGRCLAPRSREQGEGRGEGLPGLGRSRSPRGTGCLPPCPSPVLELGTLTLLSAAPPGQSLTCATSTPDESRMKAEATSVPDSPPLKAKTRALESSLRPQPGWVCKASHPKARKSGRLPRGQGVSLLQGLQLSWF